MNRMCATAAVIVYAPLVHAQDPHSPRAAGYPQYPSVSPDGSTIVFAFAGDLWWVSSEGGTARRITSHPSDESRSAWSPDGSTLAFESERHGERAVYAMSVRWEGGLPAFGEVRRVTQGDRPQTLSAFSRDGRLVYLSSNHEPAIFRGQRMYAAKVDGSSPLTRLTDAYGTDPTPTPDGWGIVFTRYRFDPTRPKYRGSATSDLWLLRTDTGEFSRLTSHSANDASGVMLPDGSLVFVSSRDGQNNIWRIQPGTDDARAEQLTRFRPTPEEITISHGVRDFGVAPGGFLGVFAVWDRLYTISLADKHPTPRAIDVHLDGDLSQVDRLRLNLSREVDEAVLSPDGRTVACAARGEIFIRGTDKDRPTRRVTNSHARERDLAWSPDGTTLYFVSDETGVYGLYAATVALAREDLAPKTPEARPAKEPGSGEPENTRPDDEKPGVAKKSENEQPPDESPAKGEPGDEKEQKRKDKDEKKPDPGKRWAEAISFAVRPVLVAEANLRQPRPSPDGRWILLTRARGDLVLLNTADRTTRDVFGGWDAPQAIWCPDSRHIIYARSDEYFNSDVWVLDALTDGAQPVNITRHPDNDISPTLSADGKVLYFLSDRDASTNDEYAVYAVNLDRKLDGLNGYELADYFKEAAESAKKRKPLTAPGAKDGEQSGTTQTEAKREGEAKTEQAAKPGRQNEEETKKDGEPLKLDLDDAYRRVRHVVAMPGGISNLITTPGGDRIVFSAALDGSPSLFSVDYRGRERKTIASAPVTFVDMGLTGERLVYVAGGEATLARPGGGDSEKLPIDAPVVIEVEEQQRQKFLEAARIVGEVFYHPTLKGLDWAGLTRRYLSLAMQTRTDAEFNAVVNNLFGELDGSHLGIRGGRSTAGDQIPLGYLGVDVSPVAGGWKVVRVFGGGPADRDASRINVGDVIVEVDGRAVADNKDLPREDLPVLLAGTPGRETLVRVAAPGGESRLVLITPVGMSADTNLRYEAEVRRRAEMVDRLSNGRLGYLHIRGMDLGSVRDFERDLYAAAHARQGLIIDVRDNGGGWTTDILLASLTAPRHAYTVPRGADPATMARDAYPRDRRLIYHYNRQISVLINQNSFSNAEIFPHAIKTIGRGKLVGVQTYGAVISTGSSTLIDGTRVRTPFRGWYLLDGTDMENNGAMPDIVVPMTPQAEAAGEDPQIEAAVRELLERSEREPFWSWNTAKP
jgi:tricorn protease